jgi:hypothetical protein
MLYPLSHTSIGFGFSYFPDRVLLFCPADLESDPVYASCIAGMTGMCHCALLIG